MSKITGLQNEIIEERLRLQEIGQTTLSEKLKELQEQYIQKLQNNKKLRSFNRSCNADFKKIYNDWAKNYSKNSTLEEFWANYANNELFDTSKYVGQINNLCALNLNSIKYSRKSQKQLLTSTIMNNNMELVRAVETESKDLLKAITSQAYMEQWTDKEYRDTLRGTGAIKPLQINGRFIRPETRLKAIARTEPMRAYNTTSYIVNKERGAKQWYAIGFDDEYTCADCIELYGTSEDPIMYDIEDTTYIPPLHPNCRHTIVYSWENDNPLTEEAIEPTEEQLKQNLTPEEQALYNKLDTRAEGYYKSYTETFKDDGKLVKLFKTKYDDALKEKEALRYKAIKGVEKKSLSPISPLENYTMETLKKDVPIDEETFDTLIAWSKKRASKNKIEYGYQFDTSTGKILGNEVRGKKGSVSFNQQGTNIGSIHTHPPIEGDVGGGSFPSKQDIKVFRSQRGADHLIGSPTEVWYIHAEENLNSGVLGQREVDKVYNKVYNEVTEKGRELVKQGKIKTDNDSLRKFLDKEIGDGLLKEFDTDEWRNKGFYIRRVYR